MPLPRQSKLQEEEKALATKYEEHNKQIVAFNAKIEKAKAEESSKKVSDTSREGLSEGEETSFGDGPNEQQGRAAFQGFWGAQAFSAFSTEP